MHNLQCIVLSVQYKMYIVQCIVFSFVSPRIFTVSSQFLAVDASVPGRRHGVSAPLVPFWKYGLDYQQVNLSTKVSTLKEQFLGTVTGALAWLQDWGKGNQGELWTLEAHLQHGGLAFARSLGSTGWEDLWPGTRGQGWSGSSLYLGKGLASYPGGGLVLVLEEGLVQEVRAGGRAPCTLGEGWPAILSWSRSVLVLEAWGVWVWTMLKCILQYLGLGEDLVELPVGGPACLILTGS